MQNTSWLRRGAAAFVIFSAVGMTIPEAASAATWSKASFAASSCDGYWPVAGRVYVVNVHSSPNRCYQNSTTSSSDTNLTGDTYSDGVAISPPPSITRWGTSVGPTSTLTLYGSAGCAGGSQPISAGSYYLTTANWKSFRQNSAAC